MPPESRSAIIVLMIFLVFTSFAPGQQLLRPTRLPFTTLERAVISELHKFFRPELIGRFDEKLVFKPLSPDTQREIALLAMTEELALCPRIAVNDRKECHRVHLTRNCRARRELLGCYRRSPHPTTRREKLITRKSQNGASNNIAIFSVLQTAHTIMTIIVIQAYF